MVDMEDMVGMKDMVDMVDMMDMEHTADTTIRMSMVVTEATIEATDSTT